MGNSAVHIPRRARIRMFAASRDSTPCMSSVHALYSCFWLVVAIGGRRLKNAHFLGSPPLTAVVWCGPSGRRYGGTFYAVVRALRGIYAVYWSRRCVCYLTVRETPSPCAVVFLQVPCPTKNKCARFAGIQRQCRKRRRRPLVLSPWRPVSSVSRIQ